MSTKKKNLNLALNLTLVVAGMLALAFASVPLYRLFCESTGYGGTPRTGNAVKQAMLAREITIRFNADTDPRLPWEFRPLQDSVKAHIGQQVLIHYEAINRDTHPVTGHAVYNVLPFSAGSYFVKIECFCFKEQTLAAGQRVVMPVLFYVDPSIINAPEMNEVKTITLSYTFFPVKTESK